MRYLLDTCVISDFIKGYPDLRDRFLKVPPDDVAISTVTQMEIHYGLLLHKEQTKKLRRPIQSLLESLHILPLTSEDAEYAAKIRVDLRKKGIPIGPYDLLLAGTALSRDLIFVTSNEKEFSRVQNLKLENWNQRN
ncbi:MAG: type II toxin-antitoxin system VapC family toxin [Deltaproteobacteria bacterium]|nr:type II toxin-antitoxin system VapC family toxin [Deltaproteobacteria bacterium]